MDIIKKLDELIRKNEELIQYIKDWKYEEQTKKTQETEEPYGDRPYPDIFTNEKEAETKEDNF